MPDADSLNGTGSPLGVYIVVPAAPGVSSAVGVLGENIIRFVDQPVLVETRSARYQAESLLHAQEGFNAYEGTDQREFTIESKFFCQNDADVVTNNQLLHVIRSLVMPDYNNTGAPPTPVKLYAYGDKNFHGIPCLVKAYTMNYPNDVDYAVSTDGKVTMPIVFTLSINLVEQHSINALRQFSLSEFRKGEMVKQGF